MKSSKSIFIFLLISTMIFSLGCGKKDKLPAELEEVLNSGNGWLRLGVYGDPMSLNPIAHIETEHGQMLNHFVHASPLRKLDDGSFVPYLFDSYSISENSGNIVLQAVWKSDLKWHDGTVFDPKDLEFTFDQIRKAENNSPYADLLKGVKSISSFGRPQQTLITFTQNSRRLLDLLTIGILPSHILKNESVDATRVEKAGVASESWPLYSEQPVGLGPYRIVAREKGRYIHLAPFEGFFDTATRTQVLVCSYFDYQQLVTDFRAKKLDWISLPSMVAEQLETMKVDNLFFIRYPNPACMTWLFNGKKPLLADKRMRHALDLLADRKKVENENPYAGVPLFDSPFASGSGVVTETTSRFAEALNLLDSLGWKDSDGDGIRDQNGQKLELSVVFNDDNLLRRAVAERFVEDCRRAGVLLTLKPVSWSDLVSQHLKKGDFDTALVSFRFPEAGNLIDMLHSKSDSQTALNFSGLSSPDLDAVLEKLDSMLPDDENAESRAKNLAMLQNFLREERPVAFLFKPYDVGIMHDASGSAQAASPVWNDVRNWKALFGPTDSKL
ncbi:MAG: ABC transporter substrate-binding protein [Candidatus Rifleibacteriota bacterium]